MLAGESKSLRANLSNIVDGDSRFLWGAGATICLGDLLHGSCLDAPITEFNGKSVLVKTRDQISTALALVELDGVARRLVICPPGVPPEYIPTLISEADIDALVFDLASDLSDDYAIPLRVALRSKVEPARQMPVKYYPTEWVLLTSGTTGVPKMVAHTLTGLTGAIKSGNPPKDPTIWGTFYDIRRYGGLQVLLRTLFGGASFVISGVDEPLGDYIARLSTHAATHLLGTPSHWRRALMSPAAHKLSLRYVRLSGEVADQPILDNLRSVYTQADIVHAYASTEAGVGFEVVDCLEGFPPTVLGVHAEKSELKIEGGSLRFRSSRTAVRYIGRQSPALAGQDGFVDTGDMVEFRGGRYYFLGRRGGIINVGGLKAHPEEIEAIINRHPKVQISYVRARNNPITGSIVVADVILKNDTHNVSGESGEETVRREILRMCTASLDRHKIPTAVHFVPTLEFNAAGKIARRA